MREIRTMRISDLGPSKLSHFSNGTPRRSVGPKTVLSCFSIQDGAEKECRLALDDITKLIDAGREKGQLKYNDVKRLIPHDVHSSEDLDDLLTHPSTLLAPSPDPRCKIRLTNAAASVRLIHTPAGK